MTLRFKVSDFRNTFNAVRGRLSQKGGNVLVYIVMLMVIFAVLGVAMVSLFSTSIGSSATVNDSRRATYLSEAGIRYTASELRAADFSKTAITTLNNTVYSVGAASRFDLNIFSPWFESASSYLTGTQSVNVDVQEGELPARFLDSLPAGDSDFLLVNFNYVDLSNPDAQSPITSFSFGTPPWTPTSFQIQLADDFVAHVNEQVAFAVKPFSGGADQIIPSPGVGVLDLKLAAKNIFSQAGGAFTVKDRDFYYKGIDTSFTDRVRLMGVRPAAGASFPNDTTIASNDPVILTPLRNRLIVSEGRSGQVTFGNNIDYAAAIVDHSSLPKSRKPDIAFEEEADLASKLSQVEQPSNPNFITVNNTERFLTIGGGTGDSLGAVWFRDTRSIGGIRNFCQETGSRVGCRFEDGIRVFFILEYSALTGGDGLVFSLINGNPAKNDFLSTGGDIERSEMLGYAGDSRLSVNGTPPPDPPFLDNSGPARGLIPPKIGLEFDTKVNFSAAGAYCADATSLNANTRNDPGTPVADNRDAVQFVYWGASALNVPCRKQPFCGSTPSCTGDPSYDDNRHNALFPNWNFDTGGDILSSPALAADGTIYVGSNSTNFFAVNPDSTEKWRVNSSGPWYSPTVTSSGLIYVGTGSPENRLYALNPADGSNVGGFPFLTGGSVTTKPAVGTTGGSNGIVYFGSDDGALRAVNSSGTQVWRFDVPGLPGPPNPIKSSPALSTGGNTVYFGTNNNRFYARSADNGGLAWVASIGSAFQSSPLVGRRAGDLEDTVYVGNDDGHLYAFNGSTGAERWSSYPTGAFTRSSPALNADGSVVYIGSSNGILFAVNTSDGSERWRFTGASDAIESAITVDANGHIYFGSNDNNVYALYPDGTQKWSFPTGGNVEAKPAVKADGTVYAGSRDHRIYSINQSTAPTNLKDLLITSSGSSPVRVGGVPVTMTSEEAKDWLKKGPWAVRLEVTRALVSGATYEFNLRAWMRQCGLDCSDVLGTFYEDTRVNYSPTSPTPHPPQIEQTIRFDEEDGNNPDFDRFIFGFTSQTAAGESQTATIRKFQLSFIRPNDLTVTDDSGWP